MKNLVLAVFTLTVCSFTTVNYNTTNLAIGKSYETFDPTMVIHYYSGGGMHYSSENIYVRYDSCVRVDMLKGVDKITKFAMTDATRKRALEILEQTKATKIKSVDAGFAHDKGTTSVCVELKKKNDFCVSSGSSTEISDDTRANFSDLCKQLNEFALNKGGSAKQKSTPKKGNK